MPPAYARIDPGAPQSPTTDRSASRVRADRPSAGQNSTIAPRCPPRTRGSTPHDHPHAHHSTVPPRTRGSTRRPATAAAASPVPPRTRGSTLAGSVGEVLTLVPPAYARIDRRRHPVGHHPPSAPRVRADRPSAESRRRYLDQCPPRTRGWTLHQRRIVAWDQVPPRTRGSTAQHAVHVGQYRVPPRTRGSTRRVLADRGVGVVPPAYARDRPRSASEYQRNVRCPALLGLIKG